MKNKSHAILSMIILVCLYCLAGCSTKAVSQQPFLCHVVLEDGTGFFSDIPYCTAKKGDDVTFTLEMQDGYSLAGADYPNYSFEYAGTENNMTLTLHEVRYSTVVTVTTFRSTLNILYEANGGERLDEGKDSEPVMAAVIPSHLRVNTALGTDLFIRQGYTQTGWNTASDGSGNHIGLGSRMNISCDTVLYAEWSKWTDSAYFTYRTTGNCSIITGYSGREEVLTIPAELGGLPVISVEKEAFKNTNCKIVILPVTLQKLEAGSFKNSAVRELYLYDNISVINDYVFEGCHELTTLHINAIEPPVYSGNYFDTFQDKYDRLLSLKDQKKIVLFSGSSTRFGYDSAKLKEAFPDYDIVNMGVFAYSNAAPQLLLILDCMQSGDILLDAPEFDAAKRQFCTSDDIDASTFCMMESNYDTFAKLDLRKFHKTFFALYSYLSTKADMTARSYSLSAADFTEKGEPTEESSYNEYGDYILYRPNADEVKPIYGLPVEYTMGAFPQEYINSVNQMYSYFLDRGVHVYFTYAPRNRYALSEDSTLEARAKLHRYFQKELIVPVISEIEDSLYPGTYLYGTDNHLSTEGVGIRTMKIIEDLKRQMTAEGDTESNAKGNTEGDTESNAKSIEVFDE